MGTLSNNKNKRNPQSQSSSNGSNSTHISKKPKPSRKTSVSRLHSYPEHITPITRKIHAPMPIMSGFNSTQKRLTRNLLKKSTPDEKNMFLGYFLAKERAMQSCRLVKFENLEQCDDDDVEVIEVGDSGNVVEVIDVDEEGSSGSSEVEEIRAKYKELNELSEVVDVDVGSPLCKKFDGSVETRSLRKLRHEVKLGELRRAAWLKLHPVKKEEEEEEVVVHDFFTPLTEEEEKRVANAQSHSNREKVFANHVNSNIMITGKALQCLKPHAWLNDEVINIYLELLKDRERREPKKYLKCHFFNTFFYKKLVSGRTRNGYDYESVKRWTAHKKLGYSLDECDKIFVPIHKEIHWCLAVINKKEKKFQYLDSLGGTDKKVLRLLAKYITDEVKDKTGKSINVTSWEQEFVTDLPSQENGYDCGMFMLKYIDFYSRDIELCFSQDDMPYFRKRTAKEILTLRAN